VEAVRRQRNERKDKMKRESRDVVEGERRGKMKEGKRTEG